MLNNDVAGKYFFVNDSKKIFFILFLSLLFRGQLFMQTGFQDSNIPQKICKKMSNLPKMDLNMFSSTSKCITCNRLGRIIWQIGNAFGGNFFPAVRERWKELPKDDIPGSISPNFVFLTKVAEAQRLVKNLPFNFINILSL